MKKHLFVFRQKIVLTMVLLLQLLYAQSQETPVPPPLDTSNSKLLNSGSVANSNQIKDALSKPISNSSSLTPINLTRQYDINQYTTMYISSPVSGQQIEALNTYYYHHYKYTSAGWVRIWDDTEVMVPGLGYTKMANGNGLTGDIEINIEDNKFESVKSISLDYCRGVVFRKNIAMTGITIGNSKKITLTENHITQDADYYGIQLSNSSDIGIKDNEIVLTGLCVQNIENRSILASPGNNYIEISGNFLTDPSEDVQRATIYLGNTKNSIIRQNTGNIGTLQDSRYFVRGLSTLVGNNVYQDNYATIYPYTRNNFLNQ